MNFLKRKNMKTKVILSATLFIFALIGCNDNVPTVSAQDEADTVFIGGNIYTVNEKQPWVEAFAVKDGIITQVGAEADVKKLIGANSKVINLSGKMALPGFIDTHAHPVVSAAMSHAFELDMNDNEKIWLQQIAEYVNDNPDKESYLGFGFLAQNFIKGTPKKEQLDAISNDKPIVIIDGTGHAAWVNSKAMEIAGIDKNTPDPIPGKHFYERDEQGNPTGYCIESQAFFPLVVKNDMMNTETALAGAPDLFWLMSSGGITSIYDAGMTGLEDVLYPVLQQLENEDQLPFRIVGSFMVQNPNVLPTAIEQLQTLKARYTTELVRPTTIKIHNDGILEGFTAALHEDYASAPGNKGATLLEADTLTRFVRAINKAGIDIHIHASGDRAITNALDAFAAARADNVQTNNRFTVAHLDLLADSDTQRFAELDVTVQTTPHWFAFDGGEPRKNILGEKRSKNLFRFKDIEAAGGRLTFGSDFPATIDLSGLFPLYNVEAGITRQQAGEPNSPKMSPQDDTLSLETMIKGYTINAAYQLNMETEIGSIEVGKKADIVILQENLFEVDTYDLHSVRVDSSYVNGKQVYKRNWKTWLTELTLDL
jgi:predicted amidohydrolase YtcJ